MSSLIDNLNSIYTTKLQIKNVIGTQSDVFSEYPALIEAALDGGGITWEEVEQAGYVVPVGTITLTENGTADVSSFAYANVAVSGSASGTYNIIANGQYEISQYEYVNVNVSGGGGSTYSIVSGYVFDTMGMTLGYMNDNTSYLSYAFTLDSMTPSVSLGEALTVSGNYDAFTSIGHILGSVEGNGTYNMTGYTPVNETSGWSEFNISNVLTEQPNVSIDFNVKLYKDQGLYGFPYDIEYTVTGYTPLVISSMTYSLDGGMIYDSMVYDSTNNVYSATFNDVSINTGGMLSPIVKVEYTTGAVKYLNGNVTLSDYGSPAVYPGYWNADPMQQMFYIDNMMGTTAKDITSLTVGTDGNITVNFTDQAAPEPEPSTNSITINYSISGAPMTQTFTNGQEVMMTFETDTLAFTDQDGYSLSADGTADYYIDTTGTQSFDVFSTASPVNVYISEAGSYYVYASFNDVTQHWSLSFTVVDKLRLNFTTAGAANSVELNNGSANPAYQVSIDVGTITFTDIATGNTLSPNENQSISIQMAMNEFTVLVAANPGTVTVQDTGLYDIWASKNGNTWTVNFTPSPGV